MKTIKELADELGVSKTAVRKHMTEDFRAAHTANLPGNIIGIDDAGCKLLAESLRKPLQTTGNQFPETPETTGNQPVAASDHPLYAILREDLAAKHRQIDQLMDQLKTKETEILNLTEALKTAQASLQAAQALHAGTMQQQIEAGEQPDWECQDETAIDVELGSECRDDELLDISRKLMNQNREAYTTLAGEPEQKAAPEPEAPASIMQRIKFLITGKM